MYKIVVEIPEEWGGYFSGQKMEILGRRGAHVKFPPWWGYGYFLELHNGRHGPKEFSPFHHTALQRCFSLYHLLSLMCQLRFIGC